MSVDFNQSMFSYYKACTAHNPATDKVWQFWGASTTRAKFIRDVENFAGYLINLGVGKGDNVVLCLSNIPNALVCFYAINRAGAIANLVHPVIPSEKLQAMDEEMSPKAYILFDEFFYKYKDWIEATGKPIILCSAQDYLPMAFKPFYNAYVAKKLSTNNSSNVVRYRDIGKYTAPTVAVDGEDVAVYMHSGGTCGKAKTVMMSNRALNNLTDNILDAIDHRYSNKDAMLMALPIFHTYGLGVCLHSMICAGIRIILMPKFKADTACYLIKRYGITFVAGVPYMYSKMLASGKFKGKMLTKIRACYCGGDKVSENTKQLFKQAMEKQGNNILLSEGYGLTEACVCCINTMKVYKPNSIGRPVKSMTFAIIDEQGNFLPPKSKGEIVISGPTLMKGYYHSEDDREAFFEDDKHVKWLRSGDVGYIDEDGNVFFTDRIKRLVKISGVNVFPQEIENVVDNLDCVKISCVVETTINGKSATKLYVVKDKSTLLGEQEIQEKIRQAIAQNFMRHSMPGIIEFIDELPRTPIGKVDFVALQQMSR
ncbi:MAG: class I adenylate-forming enzyme family protein [Christensenellales bacterium]